MGRRRLPQSPHGILGLRGQDICRLEGTPLTEGVPVRVRDFPFGQIAALLSTARRIGFVETVDRHAFKPTTPGFSVGQYLLHCILARSLEPWSKAATGRWFYRKSFLKFAWEAPHEINSQNILSNLRELADLQVQRRIEESFTKGLVGRGLRPSFIFWDASNWSTYIERGRPSLTPERRRTCATA